MVRENNPTSSEVSGAATDGGNVDRSTDPGSVPEREESLADLAQQPLVKSWVKFVGALSASIGVGMGVLALLVFNVFEASLWDISGFGSVSFTLPPDQVPYLGVFLAAFLGVYLGRTLAADETTTYLVAALSSAVGVVAVLVSSAVLTSLVVSDLSVRFGDLVIISLAAAVVVGAVGAGGVRISRQLWPDDTTAGDVR